MIRELAILFLCALTCVASPVALDLSGRDVQVLANPKQPIVLIFLAVECPIANKYAPAYKRLAEEFKEVRFIAVYPNADETAKQIKAHLKEYKIELEAVRDARHELVKATGVKTTPEAVVYAADGTLVYRGRIDNRHVSFGKKRPVATEHDLREALEALRKGKRVEFKSTPAVGCSLPPLQ